MKRFLRRFVAAASCAALMVALIPPQAALAAAPVRIEPGAVRADAVAVPFQAATLIAPLSIPGRPEGAVPFTAEPSPALPAPAAAADSPRPESDSPPKAVPPAAEAKSRFSWLRLRKGAATPESVSFDGEGGRPVVDDRVVETRSLPGRIVASLRSRLSRHSFDRDGFGGPKYEPMTLRGRVAYGLKGGLYLVGANALLDWIVAPIVAMIPWQLKLPAAALGPLGRVELLTKYGPAEISAALQHAAVTFLGVAVPASAAMEEFTYRFVGFGMLFGLLALAKPVSRLVVGLMEKIPELPQRRSIVQPILLFAGEFLTSTAFPVAASISAFNFAVAHFAKWGVDPMVLTLNIVAGLVLAGMAHRTRGRFTPGIVAPFIAHLFFNLTILGVPLLALTFGLPQAAAVFAALSSIAGVVTLWYNWRAARKDRAAALKHAGSAAALLLVAALTAGLVSNGLQPRGAVESSFLASRNQPYTAAAAGAASAADPKAPVDATVETPSPEPAAASPSAPAEMIARVKPSVVKVVVKEAKGYSIGSGVIVSPDGVVVTNGHVVGDGHKVGDVVSVRLSNGLKVPALIIAVNHNRDLALLKLPPLKSGKPWPISPFASHAPREGDVVYAMGHPLGLPFTVTKGILSGIGARGNSFVTYLQHDAAITHGNSGGPLYNEAGEIIAINTLGHEAGGIAFSIITPSVVAGLQQFAATGNMDTAALGIIINLSSPDQPEKGVVIELVRPGSAADKAGLRAGDLIIGIGDAELKDGGEDGVHQLGSILAKAKPGDKLPLGILRGDKQKILEVTLDARKTSEATSLAHNFDGEDAEP